MIFVRVLREGVTASIDFGYMKKINLSPVQCGLIEALRKQTSWEQGDNLLFGTEAQLFTVSGILSSVVHWLSLCLSPI